MMSNVIVFDNKNKAIKYLSHVDDRIACLSLFIP